MPLHPQYVKTAPMPPARSRAGRALPLLVVAWAAFLVVAGVRPALTGLRAWQLFTISLYATKVVAFFLATRRVDLDPRLRQALRITTAAFTLSTARLIGFDLLAGPDGPPVPPLVDNALLLGTYAIGLVGILRMPMARRTERSTWWILLIDVVCTVVGVGTIILVLVTLPQARATNSVVDGLSIVLGAAQTLMLAGINILVLLGVAHPSRRAFWYFCASVAGSLLTLAFSQIWPETTIGLYPADVSMLATTVLALLAADAYRRDPIAPGRPRPTPAWFRSFNPFPMLAILGVAALLVRASMTPGAPYAELLAGSVLLLLPLLFARHLLSALETTRLQAAAAALERRRQDEKMASMGRLAGGIAHWFNNLMAIVIGHAELGAAEAGAARSVREDLEQITRAANRAAALTRQLQSFSGQAHAARAPLPLSRVLAGVRAPAGATGVRLVIEEPREALVLLGDLRQVSDAIQELIVNAAAAMPGGGRVMLRCDRMRVIGPDEQMALVAPSGEYVTIAVQDEGIGLPSAVRDRMFEPFFSTRPTHEAAGLGLAAVYGIVASHGGGITVESGPHGTTVQLFFPRSPTKASEGVHTER